MATGGSGTKKDPYTLVEGTYLLATTKAAADTSDKRSYVLTVNNNADDTNGRKIKIYHRMDSDGQLIRAIKWGTFWRLQFPLSGKSLDRPDGATTNGTVCQQYDSKSVNAQKWNIVPEKGDPYNLNGVYYRQYRIHALKTGGTANTNQILTVNNCGHVVDNELITLWQNDDKAVEQEWIFIPQNPVQDGTYAIVSALNSKWRIGVRGNSSNLRTQLQVQNENVSNNKQKWTLTTESTGLTKFQNVGTNLVMDKLGGSDQPDSVIVGQYSEQTTAANIPAQRWLIERATGVITVNGNVLPLYHIHAQTGVGMVVDKSSGTDNMNDTNVIVHKQNYTPAQRWAFIPCSYLSTSLATPSYGAFATSLGGSLSTTKSVYSGQGKIYVAFLCNSTTTYFQMRYRTNSTNKAGSYGGWSSWKSISDNSTSNGGWGQAWKSNVGNNRKKIGNYWWITKALDIGIRSNTFANGYTDRAKVEVEVRSWVAKAGQVGNIVVPGYGNSLTISGTVLLKPAIKLTLKYVPEGIDVVYELAVPRGNNTITLSSSRINGTKKYTGQAASGTIRIALEDIIAPSYIKVGEEFPLNFQATTSFNATNTYSGTKTLVYGSGHYAMANKIKIGSNAVGTITTSSGATIFMGISRGHGNRTVSKTLSSTTGTFLPPIGVSYTLSGTHRINTKKWESFEKTMPAITDLHGIYISSTNGAHHFHLIMVDEPEGYEFSQTYERDADTVIMSGGPRENVTVGKTVKSSFSFKGKIYASKEDGSVTKQEKAFDYIAHQGFCIVRNCRGFWAQAAIKSTTIDRSHADYMDVTFSLTEIEYSSLG